MLRLTKKADYGLMALKYLAEQAHDSAQPASASAKAIAEAYHTAGLKLLQGYGLTETSPVTMSPSGSAEPCGRSRWMKCCNTA